MNIYILEEVIDKWIYWNQSLWLITISDWQRNDFTIADKNLWATVVWNDWDTVSASNCGNYYQWGNNYWFPFTWSVTTSSTQVDTTWYWPWNYYESSTFILNSNNWSNPVNNNLWWAWTWWNYETMRWPCAEWYHVPWSREMSNLKWAFNSIFSSYDNFHKYLKIPPNWFRSESTWDVSYQWQYWYIWTCVLSNPKWWMLSFNSNWTNLTIDERSTSRWWAIRPFSNVVVKPDSTWTILYQPS